MTRGPGSTSHTDCVQNFGCGKSEPPPAVARLFISAARNNSPVYDMGAQAHESYSLGAGSRVRKERTVARAGTAPPRGHDRRQKENFKTNAAVSRRPARGLAKPPGVGAAGQSAAGTDIAVGMTEGGLTVSASACTETTR
jgi:hypothetical protein